MNERMNTAMPAARTNSMGEVWNDFMRHSEEWGWKHAFVKFNSDVLVLADPIFVSRIKKVANNLDCMFAAPQDINDLDMAAFKSVLVFLAENELTVVNELRAGHPDKLVVSATHDFSLVSSERLPRLKVLRTPPKPATSGPIVFLSTPNAGAEYIAQILSKNGLPQPWEYVGRPFVSLSELHDDIDFFELIRNAETRYATNDGMAYIFQTDVLESLFRNTSFTEDQFCQWLSSQNARIVTIRNKDKFRQAFIRGLLNSTFNRSVWSMRKKPDFKFRYGYFNSMSIQRALRHFSVGEAIIDRIEKQLPASHSLELDPANGVSVQAIQDVLLHLGLTMPSEPEMPDYMDSFWQSADAQKGLQSMLYEMVDRLGLHALD